MKTIGAVTFHASHNYGSVLQAYALQEYIKKNFSDVDYKIINLRLPAQHIMYDFPKRKTRFRNLFLQYLNYKPLKSKYLKFENFINNYLNLTEEYSSESQIKEKFDIYLSGGDQIWNVRCKDFSWLYYLDGITSGKKVSYAPSMGPKPRINDEEKERIKKNLSEYSTIGVREKGTADIVSEILGSDDKKITVLPDPVLLLKQNEWVSLIKNMEKPNNGKPYILFYTLNCSDETYKYVKKIGKKLNKDVIVTKYLKHCDYFHYYKNCFDTGPLDFLNLIMNADLVVATSFHACVFSSIFHKNFIAIDVEHDNRIQGFFEEFNILNRNFSSLNNKPEDINEFIRNTDFTEFDKTVEYKAKYANIFLSNAIN